MDGFMKDYAGNEIPAAGQFTFREKEKAMQRLSDAIDELIYKMMTGQLAPPAQPRELTGVWLDECVGTMSGDWGSLGGNEETITIIGDTSLVAVPGTPQAASLSAQASIRPIQEGDETPWQKGERLREELIQDNLKKREEIRRILGQ